MTALWCSCPTDVRLLSVEGPLCTPVSTALRHTVRGLIRRGECHIVLDVNQVSSIDAAGLGELVRAYNMARVAQGTFRIVNPSPLVREAIARVGLLDLLKADGGAASIEGTAAGLWPADLGVPATVDARTPTLKGAALPCRRAYVKMLARC